MRCFEIRGAAVVDCSGGGLARARTKIYINGLQNGKGGSRQGMVQGPRDQRNKQTIIKLVLYGAMGEEGARVLGVRVGSVGRVCIGE